MTDLPQPRSEAADAAQDFPPTDDFDTFPLSFAQERLWFLDQFAPGSAAYNVPVAVQLSGRLDHAALAAGLDQIVERHETLRTRFVVQEGEPVQLIAPAPPLALPLVVPAAQGSAEQTAELHRLIDAAAHQPFDLQRGPLIRATLFQLSSSEHVLLLVLHHIICDGWSLGVLVREIAACYSAAVANSPEPLAPLPIQYADYAVWQREWMQGDVLEHYLSYWRRQLADLPAPLTLLADRPHPSEPTFRAATETLHISAEVVDALNTFSKQENVTLFMLLLAAFDVLLYRYTGQTDLVIGSPIANRTSHEVEHLIGFFVNMLVLRTEIEDNPPFRALLGHVRETCLEAYAHQEVPFDKLVEAVQPWRTTSRTPLFSIAFALQNAPLPPLTLPGLTARLVPINNVSAKYDLTFTLSETATGLHCSLEYDTDLFEPGTISGMLEHFATLLAGIIADPDQRVADLPLISEAEQRLLEEWGNA